MTSNTLEEIFDTIDHFNLLPRMNDDVPFTMLDGHETRLELSFFKYINDPITEWRECLGVAYGTAFQQIGVSKEQNIPYNMVITEAKLQLLVLKNAHCLNESMIKVISCC